MESANSRPVLNSLSQEEVETANLSPDLDEKKEESVRFIDSQRPGLHISTILRQIMFDVLYGVEFVVLLAFGFSSNVKVCTFQMLIYLHTIDEIISLKSFIISPLVISLKYNFQDLIDQKRRPIIVSVIIFFVVVALGLKIFYYTVMHVWRNVILTGKKLIRQEIRTGNQEAGNDLPNTVFEQGGAPGKL